MEPYLDLMRVIEIYSARMGPEFKVDVDIMVCGKSSEKYVHMSTIEDEKKAFKCLMDM